MNLIITGATKGIGKAIAEVFAGQNFDIAFCGRDSEQVAEFQSYLIAQYNVRAIGIIADISIKSEAQGFAEKAVAYLGGCDVLINNAGIFIPGSIELEADGIFESQMGINLNAAYYITQKLIPYIKKGKRPHIFNMCSIASITAYPNGSSYCVSKFALLGLTKVLRQELIEVGIAVTAVMPGATLTESWGDTTLPSTRFIKPKNIADAVWNAWQINENTVVEEIILRPLSGDI